MSHYDLYAQVIGVLACAVILWRAEPALAHMTKAAHLAVRLSMWLAVVGSVARIGWIWMGNVPDPITILMLIGMAALITCERRIRLLTGQRRRYDDKKRGILP